LKFETTIHFFLDIIDHEHPHTIFFYGMVQVILKKDYHQSIRVRAQHGHLSKPSETIGCYKKKRLKNGNEDQMMMLHAAAMMELDNAFYLPADDAKSTPPPQVTSHHQQRQQQQQQPGKIFPLYLNFFTTIVAKSAMFKF
jgi:hypothetical protein